MPPIDPIEKQRRTKTADYQFRYNYNDMILNSQEKINANHHIYYYT